MAGSVPGPLDVTMRSVDMVEEEGAVFILVAGYQAYRVEVIDGEATSEIITLPPSPRGPASRVLATSYKHTEALGPVFLMAGFVDYDEDSVQGGSATAAVIFKSKDGRTWEHVFTSEQGIDQGVERPDRYYGWTTTPNALVWSDGEFYYDQVLRRPGLAPVMTPTGFAPWRHEQVLRSANGAGWGSPVLDQQIWYGAEALGYRSEFPRKYCTDNDCKDALDQNVPDGFMSTASEPPAKPIIQPDRPITINYGTPSFEQGNSNYYTANGKSDFVPDMLKVNCAAGTDEIWMVGGLPGAAVSIDAGKTWEPLTEGLSDAFVNQVAFAPDGTLKDAKQQASIERLGSTLTSVTAKLLT